MELIRTFVAIDVKMDNVFKNKWQELKLLLRSEQIKWVDENSLHLTLFFLGDTPANTIDNIVRALEIDLVNIKAFNLKIQGFGTFGNPSAPKVIWAGIERSESLNFLKETVRNAITSKGFEEKSDKFHPHFTLGRIKVIQHSKELINFIGSNKLIILQESVIDNVIFYQSVLKPTGPIYKPIRIFKLPSL